MPLGKNLNNILDDYFGEGKTESMLSEIASKTPANLNQFVREIQIDQIQISSFQTRRHFDQEKIDALANNIKQQGLIQPIVVLQKKYTKSEIPEYVLLAGERRLRAHKKLKKETILALVKKEEELDETAQAFLSAMENLQREDLSPIELAETFKMLKLTQNLDDQALADKLNFSPQHVRNYLRLLTLCENVKQALLTNQLREGQARFLVGLDEKDQKKILQKILAEKLTVKEVEALVKTFKKDQIKNLKNFKIKPDKPFSHTKHQEITDYIQNINDLLGEDKKADFKFEGNDKKGKIVIQWK